MKNRYLFNTIKCVAIALMTMGLVNCAKKGSSSTNVNSAGTATGYRCYSYNGAQVDNTQCTSRPNSTQEFYCRDTNGGVVSNGSCYATQTTSTGYTCTTQQGQIVSNSLCTQNSHNGSYYICRNSSGAQVSNSLCGTATSGAYTLVNGQCYMNTGSAMQPVAYSYCLNGSNGSSNGYVRQNCNSGTFYYYGQTIQCGVTHTCPSGLIMQNGSGQTIQCM